MTFHSVFHSVNKTLPIKQTSQRKKSYTPRKKRNTSHSPDNLRRAKKLEQANLRLNLSHKINRKKYPVGYIRTWATSFSLLLVELEFEHSRLDSTLDWYLRHCTWKGCPKATTGRSFRFKFYQIEEAKCRWEQLHPKVKISTWTKKFVKEHFIHESLGYSTSFVLKFQKAVQFTLDTYTKFYKNTSQHKVCKHYHHLLPDPFTFCTDWWMEVFTSNTLKHLRSKTFEPMHCAFRPSNPRALRWLKGWFIFHGMERHATKVFKEQLKSLS